MKEGTWSYPFGLSVSVFDRNPSVDAAALKFESAGRSTRIVAKVTNAGFRYSQTPILQNLDFEIERGDRIGLVGANGSGKTTLIKLLLGQLKPGIGNVELGRKLTIGYYDQLTENLDQNSTPLETIWGIRPEFNEGQTRSYLGKFLFRGEEVFRKVALFSGGEQSRLSLARLIATSPNFLILDEPTNHLDIQSREALEEALGEYDGTILCVSHDRFFLDRFSEKIFALNDGNLTSYLGNYSDYRNKISLRKEPEEIGLETKTAKPKRSANSVRRTNPMLLKKLEDEITRLEGQIIKIEDILKADELSADWQKLTQLLGERDELYDELSALYEKRTELTKK